MKKLLLLGFLLSGFVMSAQAYPSLYNSNEIKLNIGLFLATSTVEGSYEYYFSENASIGATVYFDNDATDYNGDFGIGPNFRAYFGYQPRSGFFAEAFGLYYIGEDEINNDLQPNRDYSTTALGLGLGNKWSTRDQRFTVEIFGGLGRNINPEDFQDDFMYRGGLSVGFRF